MSAKPSADFMEAMRLIMSGEANPRQAAIKVGMRSESIYRSAIYKAWRDGEPHPALKKIEGCKNNQGNRRA